MTKRWRGHGGLVPCLTVVVLTIVTAACSSSVADDASRPGGSAAPPPASGQVPVTAGAPGLEVAREPAVQSTDPKLPDQPTDVVLDKAATAVTLDAEQRACAAARLDKDPDLRAALGADPATSPRWPDLMKAMSDCINTVSFSADWSRAVQSQSGGTLSAEQMHCLRQAMAAFTSEDVEKIRQAGIEPEKADAALGARVDQVLAGCQVDKAKLAGGAVLEGPDATVPSDASPIVPDTLTDTPS